MSTDRARSASGVLAVVGDLVEDVVVWARETIRIATDTSAEIHRTRGGSAANVAALAAPLHPTRFLGCAGADPAGDALAAELASHGVDVRLQRRGRTGTVVLLIDESGERTMFPDRGAAALLERVDASWLDGVGILHAPSYGFEQEPARSAVVDALARARADGALLSVDASSTGLLSALGTEDYLSLIEAAAPDLLLANAEEAALLGLPGGGLARIVIVKDGPRPTRVHRDGRLLAEVPVEPVRGVRDLTGAGDAFAAGLLATLLEAPPAADLTALDADVLAAACRVGHRTAASVLGRPGAGGDLGTPDPSVNPD